MDLQTRKLNLITYLAQLQDESFFEKIENYILRKQADEKNADIKPFTVDELINRIEKSEQDFQYEKFQTQEELEKKSSNW
ncbi:hypothetical protein CMT42_00915 [Elizabethkingia anophelis]|uniref:hypothetical protein n=1 Tax=Elizabethkingia anophelis TaxID=1117645 RepID=UPI00038A5323|nr:hypothetical protein [Elizabethkingia anophelis]ELB0066934.1 hypothetical protein [Elizabethkingia anophelis]ELB1891628.1 hypothetical protein [Elizabethkingia anophelis]EQB90814.1 hypothetical protein C874_13975 [Elizabethkingia anophelis 502]MCT3639165.1 hypothetical protein [Elizabethkingia anophelis]MCT3646738.1 hypothetical protein [Elizabethkingia anophelis]